MHHTNLLTALKLWANQNFKRQHSTARTWRTATVLGFLAVAILSLTLGSHIISTAHAQQAAQVPESASLSQARAASANISPKKEVVEQSEFKTESSDVPIIQGGTGCGWTAGTVYPIPVLDNAAASVGTNLYSFAGVSNGELVADSFKFDGTTWTAIAPLPAALESPAAASNGTFVYIVGGANDVGDAVNTLYRYDPAANTYSTLAPAPTATWNSAAVFLNGKVYKITGFTSSGGSSGPSTAVEIYDIASNTWTTAAPYPVALGFVSAFAQGGFLYVAGGVDIVSGAGSVKTYRYDPAANTWDDAAIADLPADRWGAAYGNYNGGAVLAAGFVAGTVSNTAVIWRSSTNTWVTLPNALQARGRLAGGVANSAFYAIGGRSTAGGFNGTNDNQRLFCPPLTDPFYTGTVTYVSDNGTPVNNVPDPGETVTVSLNLQNIGGGNSTGPVTATLQATGGIVPVTASQSYGVLTAGGAAVSRNFTFTVPAGAACGSQITLTFSVTDGTTTTTVTQTYNLGVLQTSFSENFDGVTAPALPAGWTSAQTGSNPGWVTRTTTPDSAPNSAFAPDLTTPGGADLTSPVVNIATATARLNFRLNYNTESTWDGGILEIKIGSGAFQEITAAGGTFVTGGYNSGVRGTGNPLGVQPAWSGNSNGYINVSVNLPASANGQGVQFKWRIGHDDSVAATGINLDNVTVTGSYVCSTPGGGSPTNTRLDFDADGKTDLSVFRSGTWYVQKSSGGFNTVQWGAAGDQLVPEDYDGDGKTDYAVFRPNATAGATDFYVLNSVTNTFSGVEWGTTGDVAKPGDFTGDSKADFAVYRSSNNTWYVLPTAGGTPTITSLAGTTGAALPIVLDYDGDGKTDLAQVNNGSWFIRRSTDGIVIPVSFGQAGDRFVPADYDDDDKDDLAVFRNGQWIALKSSTNTVIYINFGQAGDIPVPGDYDGDGADDQAVYRNGTWYINNSGGGVTITTFGIASDIPVPSVYVQ